MNLLKFHNISKALKSHQKLIAVSKGQDVAKIKNLYDIGHRDFGENFLQELKQKKDILPKDITWHFLGNIQSNKVKDIVACSDLVHSVSRLKVLDKISQLDTKKNVEILLQLKLGKEQTKSGFSEIEIYEIMERNQFKNLVIKGLMVIGEGKIEEKRLKEQFLQASNVFNKMKTMKKDVEYLSMGMSNDYELALAHGSNMIRIGTSIFGERN
tara:strand:+ start:552 stop:1187 length:636 start_codon:yes stop_codon:yes gene_type:complete